MNPSQSRRIVFIDLLRGWAGLVMIEVHVFNAFLRPEIKESGWFTVLTFANGLVAPAFLFVAGMVFAIVSERKMEEFRMFGTAFWRQLGRIGLIWGVGYALHIPYFSFSKTVREASDADWLKFYQSDVLHCIAAGLLVMFVARLVLSNRSLYAWFLGVTGIGAVLVAPFIWTTDFNVMMHPALGAYFNALHSSLFPLFPWLGFTLLGGVLGIQYRMVGESDRPWIIRITRWGAGAVVLYYLFDVIVGAHLVFDDARANPLFFALRFGVILLLLALCWWYGRIRETTKSFVLDVSRETLLVYAGHLLIIYGTFWEGRSLSGMYGGTLSVAECVVATILLSALMIVAAKGWSFVKGYSVRLSRALAVATGLLVTIIFFIK